MNRINESEIYLIELLKMRSRELKHQSNDSVVALTLEIERKITHELRMGLKEPDKDGELWPL